MKKYFWVSILLVLIIPFQSFSQLSFSNSLGVGIYINSSTSGFGGVYSPRINFLNFNDNVTLSIGTHFGLGFSASANSVAGSSTSSSLLIDAPLVLEVNVGHACNTDNTNNFGFFIGGGAGFNSLPYTDDEGNPESNTLGVLLNAGVRSNFGNGPSLEARFSYLVDATGLSSGVFAINIAYTFGMERGYY